MAVIIVTGGFGALGRAVVRLLAETGHRPAAIDVVPVPPDHGAALALGGVDLAEETGVTAAYAQVAANLGPIAGVVNIAGGFVWETVSNGSLDSFDRMFRMNLRTAAASCRAAIPHLSTGSAIVNVGAAGAVRPGEGFAAYAASKTGVHALTESLAEELKARGIRVNAVLPTILDTPTNRADMPDADTSAWVRPEAAARVIAFLLSAGAGAITGAAIPLSLAG